jgi:hypothetical protein
LAISEVFCLAEQHPTATILITADVDQERAKAIQQHYPTLHLKTEATVQDIIWELVNTNCSGSNNSTKALNYQ